MPLKDVVNNTIRRATGYHLTRVSPEQHQAELDEAVRRARQEARARGKRELQEYKAQVRREREETRRRNEERREKTRIEREQRAAEQAERRRAQEEHRKAEAARAEEARRREQAERFARGEDLPKQIEESTRDIIVRVRPRTMTQHHELVALVEAIKYLERLDIPGEIVECGVWRGGSMQAAALTLHGLGSTERELHLFDTFEGMPPPSEIDVRVADGKTADEIMADSDKDARIWAYADLADVQQAMKEVDYPSEKIFFHQGLVEETVPASAPERIALLRLDTDWYESTKHELEHLYDRLVPGGVLIIDDYRAWEGSGRATDEWLAATGEPIFLAPMGPGRIAVKPFGPRS